MQVDPTKPALNPPGTERLKLSHDKLLSNVAFKIILRHYNKGKEAAAAAAAAGETLNPLTTPEEKKEYELRIAIATENESAAVEKELLAAATEMAAADLVPAMQVGPGQTCHFLSPNSLCSVSQIQPITLGLCPIMPPMMPTNFPKDAQNPEKLPKITGIVPEFSICLLCRKYDKVRQAT